MTTPPPKQNPTAPILPLHCGKRLEEPHGGREIVDPLDGIERAEHLRGLLLVAGIAAERRERVRRESHEPVHREPAGDILDVRIEAAVLVDHHDARPLARPRGPGKVALHRAGGRRVGEVLGREPRVVLRDLLRERVIGTQRFQHRRGREAADGILAGLVEEIAAGEPAVHVSIEQFQDFGREIAGFHSFHGRSPSLGLKMATDANTGRP